jgi:hypothetical protein
VKGWLVALATVAALSSTSGFASEIATLEMRLREHEAEAAALRRQIDAMRSTQRNAPRGEVLPIPPPPITPSRTAPAALSWAADEEDEETLASALESALVRQGGRVLSAGTIEIEPELTYLYDEPTQGRRQDAFGAALTVRLGLPWATQAEVRLPYSLQNRLAGVGTSTGFGDIRLGLTKQLVAERDWVPAILAFGQWRTSTGSVDRNPSTGYGVDALQLGLSVAKRQDPIVLFGSLAYTTTIGRTTLRTGQSYEPGDIFGGRIGAFLAATPDTSIMLAVSANSFAADRVNDVRNTASDRLRGTVEFGTATTLGRGLFLAVTAGVGVTPAAPDFSLSVTLPFRF